MSHNSNRSLRTKADARQRPDVIWRDQSVRLQSQQGPNVLVGGSELSQLIVQADGHLAAMRKIVQ